VQIRLTCRLLALTVAWDPSVGSVLDLAELHGLRPDFSCRSGICHTCMSRLIDGHVKYLLDIADEPDPSHVLICSSRRALASSLICDSTPALPPG